MRARDLLPYDVLVRFLTACVVLCFIPPGATPARASAWQAAKRNAVVSITFGQELGNMRPFRVTVRSNGEVHASGPIQLVPSRPVISQEAIAGLILLADTEGFRSEQHFTGCPGVLPDIAVHFVSIKTPRWHRRAATRGSCVPGFNQVFAVLMALTHASF